MVRLSVTFQRTTDRLKCFVVYVVLNGKFMLILWLDLGRKSFKIIQIYCQ